jgi:hypothetical protein
VKKLIFTLILLFLTCDLYAQTNNIDYVVPYGRVYYRFTLTAAIDTADLNFLDRNAITYYTITTVSTAVDTIQVWTLSIDGVTWVQKGIIDLASQSIVTEINATTTAKEFLLIDPQPVKIRLISTSNDASTCTVLISGKKGILGIGNLSTVSIQNDVQYDSAAFSLPSGGASAALHAIGDVVAPSLTAASCPAIFLPTAARTTTGSGPGSGGYITYFALLVDSAINAGTVQATFTEDTVGMSYIADNAAYARTMPMGRKTIGTATVNFTGQGTSGASCSFAEANCMIPYRTKAGSAGIYMRLSAVTAVTFKYGGTIWYKVSYDRN